MLSRARFIPALANPDSAAHELVDGPIVQMILVSRACESWEARLMTARSLGYRYTRDNRRRRLAKQSKPPSARSG